MVAAAGWLVSGYADATARQRAGLPARSLRLLALRSAALLAALVVVTWYLNQNRGVGWMVVFFVALVLLLHYALVRTHWGRSVHATGGSPEAARRAGINVRAVYTSAFMLCSMLAATGGILSAARLTASTQSAGTGDINLNAIAAAVIGGTSLFGGRGTAFAALFGILVIQSISSGLTLLSLGSSFRFVVTGLVLLLAVAVDAVARGSRSAHGRG